MSHIPARRDIPAGKILLADYGDQNYEAAIVETIAEAFAPHPAIDATVRLQRCCPASSRPDRAPDGRTDISRCGGQIEAAQRRRRYPDDPAGEADARARFAALTALPCTRRAARRTTQISRRLRRPALALPQPKQQGGRPQRARPLRLPRLPGARGVARSGPRRRRLRPVPVGRRSASRSGPRPHPRLGLRIQDRRLHLGEDQFDARRQKHDKHGRTGAFSPASATGTRANPEQCLLATRGAPRRRARDVKRLVVEPRREHSRDNWTPSSARGSSASWKVPMS